MEVNIARSNMVQQQVRAWDVLDPSVLEIMSQIPRELFVAKEFQQLAFSDAFVPIGFDQVSLKPNIIGRMLQALQLNKKDSVLEVGTGTGYITALAAHFVKSIISIEIIPELSQIAKGLLRNLGIFNVNLEVGNAATGYSIHAPYDVIMMTGSVPCLPKGLIDQLAFNGRLFVVVGNSPAMSALLITRHNKNRFTDKILFETDIPPLQNAEQPNKFRF